MSHQELSLAVVRVRSKTTLARPEYAQFVLRGARACGFREPGAVLADLLLEVGDPRIGVFAGTVAEEPRGIAIAQLPLNAFMLEPMVVLAYSERAPAPLVRQIGRCLAFWIRASGHARALSLNLRHTDRAFQRGLGHFGVPTRAGSVIAFELAPGFGEAK